MRRGKVHQNGLGCAMTGLEKNLHLNFFRDNGFEVTDRPEEADFILYTTCGNLDFDEENSIAGIKEMNRVKKPGAVLVVTGCLPKINPGRLKEVFGGPIVPARSPEALKDLLERSQGPFDRIAAPGPAPWPCLAGGFETPYAVPTSKGCLSECTFCVIRFAIGRLQSRPIDEIVRDVAEGARRGYRDIFLVGDDNGFYGFDIKTDMTELLERIFELPDDFRLIVTGFNPWGFERNPRRMAELVKCPKFLKINVPMQHASERILRLMKRPYRAAGVKEQLLSLRAVNPRLQLCLGMIVGFPGETEAESEDCVRFIRDIEPDDGAFSTYCDRPNNTVPKELVPVGEEEKLRRLARIKQEVLLATAARQARFGRPAGFVLPPGS